VDERLPPVNVVALTVPLTSKVVVGAATPTPTLLLAELITKVFVSKFRPFGTEAVAALIVKLSDAASPKVVEFAETIKSVVFACSVPVTSRSPVIFIEPERFTLDPLCGAIVLT
jgi:hypothetical protein